MKDSQALREGAALLAGANMPAPGPGDDDLDFGRFAPLVRSERLSAAVLDRRARPLHADGLFAEPDVELAATIDSLPAAREGRVVVFDWRHPSGQDMPVAFAPVAAASQWRLPAAARAALVRTGASSLLLTAGSWRAEGALEETCAAYGVTPGQARLVAALVREGDLRTAADSIGITYATARTLTADAMARMGVRKLTALITRVIHHTFGVLPSDHQAEDLLEDLWGLNARQAALAMAVAQGAGRAEAARSLGMSEALAKKELANIFLSAGVSNAGALSRRVADAMSLSTLVKATHGDVVGSPETLEPTAFAARPDGGVIAYSDYGPKGGRPVLIVHTNFSSRHAPTRLIEMLQRAGRRPLAIDRPGFGLTDGPGAIDAADQAIDDLALVMGRLKIDRADLVVRGGFRFVRRLVTTRPDLAGRIVMTSVPPVNADARRRATFYYFVQSIARRRPHLIRELARMSGRLFPISDLRRHLIDALKGSTADLAAIEDARNFADYWRGLRTFCAGRVEGFIAEQAIQAFNPPPEPLDDARHWTVMTGAQDPLYDLDEADAAWARILPGARFVRLADAGRLLVFSHPEAVAKALD